MAEQPADSTTPEQRGAKARGAAGADPGSASGTGAGPAAGPVGGTGAGPADESDPGADVKARYREALAHKHGSSGAHKKSHGDQGESAHTQTTGPTQRLFRRKSGG